MKVKKWRTTKDKYNNMQDSRDKDEKTHDVKQQ